MFVDDNALLSGLGATGESVHTKEYIIAAWRAHCESWVKPDKPMTPREIYMLWEERSESTDSDAMVALAKFAMRAFSRPISAACCERIFSYLSKMDSSDRSNMKKATLAILLFLRGNHVTVAELADEYVVRRVQAAKAAVEKPRAARELDVAEARSGKERKRKRRDDAAAADADADAAAAADGSDD